jgi:AAA domain
MTHKKSLADALADAYISEDLSDQIEPMPRPNGRAAQAAAPKLGDRPVMLSVADLFALKVPKRQMLVETILPQPGLVTMVGSHKSGKTVLAVQIAVAVASGQALMGNYRVTDKGPVIIVEQDDPDGDISVKDYLSASPVPGVLDLPIKTTTRIKYRFGPEFYSWLESEIVRLQARLVILDSYTALRPHRRAGGDIVKVESDELTLINSLGMRNRCTLALLHHVSGGRVSMDWSDQAGGTYAQGQAVNGQIHVSRFRKLGLNAPERLVQGRIRHGNDFAAVVRFRADTLDYEFVLEGSAAPLFPELRRIKKEFGNNSFTPKDLYQTMGISRQTGTELIGSLMQTDALTWLQRGEYRLSEGLAKTL